MPDVTEVAKRLINRVEQTRSVAKTLEGGLKKKHPGWAEYGRQPGDDFLARDARIELFRSVDLNLQNAQLGYTFLRDQLGSAGWWNHQAQIVNQGIVEATIREWRIHVRASLFYHTTMAVEETLRAIVRAAPATFQRSPDGNIARLTREVLAKSGLEGKYGELFRLTRLIRNTVHNNGVFRPQDGQAATVQYGGESFDFRPGEMVTFGRRDFEELVPRIIEELARAMFDVVTAKPVSEIAHCPRAVAQSNP